jgi:hypothetical protein
MKIWILGQSMSLPYDVDEHQGWPYLLSKALGIPYQNLAQPAVDNFFIYHCFLEILDQITEKDIVIIGWSHPSRKTFVLDRKNIKHTQALDYSLNYKTKTNEFIRSRISPQQQPNNKQKWLTMLPAQSGLDFYDQWFDTYYSAYEQQCNFQSYLDSVALRCPGAYIPFFFSKESVDNVLIPTNAGYMLDFVIKNNVSIGENNLHLNPVGHELWTKHLINYIDLEV